MGEAVETLVELLGDKKEDEDEEGKEEGVASAAAPGVVTIPLPPSLAPSPPLEADKGAREGESCRMDVMRLESVEGEEEDEKQDEEEEEEGGRVHKVLWVLQSSLFPFFLPPSLSPSLLPSFLDFFKHPTTIFAIPNPPSLPPSLPLPPSPGPLYLFLLLLLLLPCW